MTGRDGGRLTNGWGRVVAGGLALGLALAGCDGGDSRVRERETPRDTAAAGAPGAAAPAQAPVAAFHVALDGDGLRLVDAATGSARAIPFGMPAEQAIAAVGAALGVPRARGTNQDCGAGPLDFLTFDDGLLLAVQDGRFVGWTVRAAGPHTPTTMSGIGLGSTRAALEGAYSARVQQTSLGIEFFAGGLQGVLASDAASAPITDLWAGTSCVAR